MRTFVCLVMLLVFGGIATACNTQVALSAPQTYCPAPQADPVNPQLGAPLAPQTYNQQTLRLATQDYNYNTNRNVLLLRADNSYHYRTRNLQVLRVDNHHNNTVAIVHGSRTRASAGNGGNATVVNVQQRSGLLGLRRTNTVVKVGGGGPNVSVKAGGRGPAVSVKAGGTQVKVGGGKAKGRGRRR